MKLTPTNKQSLIENILLFLRNYSGELDEHGVIRAQLGNMLSEALQQYREELREKIENKLITFRNDRESFSLDEKVGFNKAIFEIGKLLEDK